VTFSGLLRCAALAAACVAASCTTSASRFDCAPPANASVLYADPQVHFILLGEHHGTNEMPAAAAELACAAAQSRRVLLALEIPEDEQTRLRRYVRGEIDVPDVISSSPFWERGVDGRNSAAMLGLLTRMRELRERGLDIDVAAVTPRGVGAEERARVEAQFELAEGVDRARSFSDLFMADRLIRGRAEAEASLVIMLVGSAHADREVRQRSFLNPASGQVTRHPTIALGGALPRENTMTVLLTHSGGQAYARYREESGVRPVAANANEAEVQGFIAGRIEFANVAYDARIFVGPITASLPASTPQP
jgi:hypothetical protein